MTDHGHLWRGRYEWEVTEGGQAHHHAGFCNFLCTHCRLVAEPYAVRVARES